jgi:hypothetical protein
LHPQLRRHLRFGIKEVKGTRVVSKATSDFQPGALIDRKIETNGKTEVVEVGEGSLLQFCVGRAGRVMAQCPAEINEI